MDPATYERLFDFFEIYVAHESPLLKSPLVNLSYPVAFQAVFGISGPGGLPALAPLPPDPIMTQPTYDLAKAAFEAQPPVRVLFDNGAGNTGNPGWPYPAFERSYSGFPIPGTTARSWYVGPGGALADQPAADPGADQFTWDSHARPPTDFTGDTGSGAGGLWTALPDYNWTQDPDGTAAAYVTPPLTQDTSVIGAGRVDLWVRSSTPNVDLQATVSEVRPDGKETFVQGGWIRAKARKLDDAKSTELEPVPSFRQEDFADMPADQYVPVTIPLYYEGHMYRKDSRIRVRISAPNGDQPIWSFAEADPPGQANVEIGYGPGMPSRLALPVVPGDAAPTGLPPCPGLRGEPCRDYVPFTNHAGALPSSDGSGVTGGAGGTAGNSGTQNATQNTPGPDGTQGASGVAGTKAKKKKCKRHRKHKRHKAAATARKRCRHK